MQGSNRQSSGTCGRLTKPFRETRLESPAAKVPGGSLGEVLPFSDAVALTYEYPCALGKEQEGLHRRLFYSSVYGLELLTPAKSGKLRAQGRREQAYETITWGIPHVGYVPDEVDSAQR